MFSILKRGELRLDRRIKFWDRNRLHICLRSTLIEGIGVNAEAVHFHATGFIPVPHEPSATAEINEISQPYTSESRTRTAAKTTSTVARFPSATAQDCPWLTKGVLIKIFVIDSPREEYLPTLLRTRSFGTRR